MAEVPNLRDVIPEGLCRCGCGGRTSLARVTDRARGRVKGRPMRYLHGHNARRTPEAWRLDPETGCHEWLRNRGPDGYGKVRCPRLKAIRPAHVVAYEVAIGPIPPLHEVHHRCENRGCVNPAHLILVHESAHKRLHAKLTPEQVTIIRATPKTWGSGVALAKRFGISPQHVTSVRNYRTWRDIPDA